MCETGQAGKAGRAGRRDSQGSRVLVLVVTLLGGTGFADTEAAGKPTAAHALPSACLRSELKALL